MDLRTFQDMDVCPKCHTRLINIRYAERACRPCEDGGAKIRQVSRRRLLCRRRHAGFCMGTFQDNPCICGLRQARRDAMTKLVPTPSEAPAPRAHGEKEGGGRG